ncbi:uncharacterized protein [Eurosta solidaginis]|uniref:uncharacterized protein n=1 Tax=Eurosta solidaginis TaxID=178769 RepID=UPI00353076BF
MSKNFQGSWYLHSRYPFVYDENYRCNKIDYTPGPNNVHRIKRFQIRDIDDYVEVNTGTLTCLPDGEFQVIYDERGSRPPIYKILSYCKDYIIFYVCQNLPSKKHDEYLWIYTKNHKPPKSVMKAYMDALEAQNISTGHLEWIIHENCAGYGTKQKSVAQQQSSSKGKSVC